MTKHEIRFGSLRVVAEMSVREDGNLAGKFIVLPPRGPRYLTVFVEPNEYGRLTPHITLGGKRSSRGRKRDFLNAEHPWEAGCTIAEFAAFFDRAGALLVERWLAATRLLSPEEVERLVLAKPREEPLAAMLKTKFEAKRPCRWNVSVAKLESLGALDANLYDFVAPEEVGGEAASRPWQGCFVNEDDTLTPIMVGFFESGLPESIENEVLGHLRSGGWYELPMNWTTDDLMVDLAAGLGPGFWTAARKIGELLGVVDFEKLKRFTERALARRAALSGSQPSMQRLMALAGP